MRLLVETLESRRLLAAVSIPTNLTGAAGSAVSAPVQIDTASGVRAAEIRITYDTAKLNLDNASVQAGSVWSGNSDTQVTANVNDAAGTIVIFVSSANDLSSISGSLALLNFTVASNATPGETAVLNLTLVTLNEGAINVTPAPTAGADSTDGLITIIEASSGNGSISGFVFADANRNGVVDAGEAIGGVTITLVNTTTGTSLQTVTANDGSYRFDTLAAASYQLQQQQPAAFFDSSPNQISLQLAAGANVTDQNFIEGGLLPIAISTRLRTTLVMPVGSAPWQSAVAGAIQSVTVSSQNSLNDAEATQSVLLSSFADGPTAADSNTAVGAMVVNGGLNGEGEFVPMVDYASAAPTPDQQSREKERLAALEQALLQLSAS